VVQAKVRLQAAEWDELWAKKVAIEEKKKTAYQAKEARRLQLDRQKEEAADRTADAQQTLQALREVLSASLSDSKAVNWEALKDRTPFPRSAPKAPERTAPPEQARIPEEPSRTWPKYQPHLGLLDRLMKSRRLEKEALKAQAFDSDMRAWEAARDHILADHAAKLEAHSKQQADLEAAHAKAVAQWEAERDAFTAQQTQQHAAMDAFRARYLAKEPPAIMEYCDLVLSNSDHPECFPKESDLDFNHDTGVLVVNYRLPAPSDIPTLSEVKYVQSSDSFTEKHLSEANSAKLYDEIIYEVALRTMNELLESDQAAALTSVVFNGFVTATDRGTGNEVTACIISVQASKETLRTINLSKVDPKACFRQLKGVGSSKLHSVTPVAPIINIRRDDERFIESYGVADRLNEGFNLAAMDWEDFEHLIREIFEKEFTSSGGEVRVTQASRDGGVDAVAFDPDRGCHVRGMGERLHACPMGPAWRWQNLRQERPIITAHPRACSTGPTARSWPCISRCGTRPAPMRRTPSFTRSIPSCSASIWMPLRKPSARRSGGRPMSESIRSMSWRKMSRNGFICPQARRISRN
jgi:restriction system protein